MLLKRLPDEVISEYLSFTDNLTNGLICHRCRENFLCLEDFKKHLRIVHLKETVWFCDLCPKIYFRKTGIKKHMRAHNGDLCPKSFRKNHWLRDHMNRVHLRSFECDICGFRSNSKRNLKTHVLCHLSKPQCRICFNTVPKLSRHMRNHVTAACPKCKNIFKKPSLKGHVKICGNSVGRFRRNRASSTNNSRNILGPVVVMKRLNATTLKKYLKNTPKFYCDLCSKFYFIKSELVQHLKTVHCKKIFACNVCDFKASTQYVIEKHKSIHALKDRCKICNKNVASIRKHLATAHRPKETCPICSEEFSKAYLKIHLEQHAETKFKCKDCDAGFLKKKLLRR